MEHFIGIDFGTTNTAVGFAARTGPPQLARFPDRGNGQSATWRSVLYFEPVTDPHRDGVSAGNLAIERYLADDGDGRLILSIKSHLASALFAKTEIQNKSWTIEALVAAYLRQVRQAVGMDLGRRAVVGRPVRYWGAKDVGDEQRALERMRKALDLAGFDEVVFEYEPIAAAFRYAARLDRDELVLIADFGGGTSDFSLLRIGPDLKPGDGEAILATDGLGVGGDTFDARIIDVVVSPLLGKGTSYRDEFGAEAPVPNWIYSQLRRWHQLSFLRSRKTMALLERIEHGACDPGKIANLLHMVEDDLGLPLHQSIEQAKVALSQQMHANFYFERPPIRLASDIERSGFNGWITPDLDAIDAVIDTVLDRAGVATSAVDRVFTTGGSSFVPAIRERLSSRFSADRILGGDELTSVAWGLAVRARQLFGP